MSDEASARFALRCSLVVGLVALAYAILRYVIVGNVAPAHLPLFVLDKALAFTAATLLAACLAVTPLMRLVPRLKAWGRLRKHLGLAAFAFAALHVAVTLILLGPSYYDKLHGDDGRMTFQGELALLMGLAALVALLAPALTSLGAVRGELRPRTWTRLQRLSIAALALVGAHLLTLGLPGWLTPAKWAAGLPPITLLAFALVLATFVLRRVARR